MGLNKISLLKTLGVAAMITLGTQSCNLYDNLTNNKKEKTEEKIDTNKITTKEAYQIKDLMTKLLAVIDEKDSHIYPVNGDTLRNDIMLKDAYGKDVKFTIEYNANVSGIANNIRNDYLPEAKKTITFTWNGTKYKLHMTFDPEHKAKIYGVPNGSQYEVRTSDFRFYVGFGGRGEKEKCLIRCYDVETGKQNIKSTIILLEEILNLNPLAGDSISKIIPQKQIQETENQMNEIFEYGRQVIFKSNQSQFNSEKVEKGLDKLCEMLKSNPLIKIKITGYYGGVNAKLPLERAEKVKEYLIKKGIAPDRVITEGGKEQIARSIKIEIIK